ncbi:sensor domain-containing diguanylate cyclase [Novosphingobium sp. PY1]|uniref:sensor domain-containing diguanylate cyclase n=1 Tax=Novosphingobium sp. PY1 TaxID=1882221 RepID=UPI000BE776CB|nr:sensor domain-containing diguanylate cyclase [Novosphingobium sp. PY1]BBA74217.1 diguanylate cyclase [Novosphingobium sp. PY1]GFM31454.1 diguanylate cyclase [Novosphingobium sp. PY1]
MRLSTITNWAYGATVALTLLSGATMLMASAAQKQERDAVQQRYELDHATSLVAEDIGVLSGLARQYAISGSLADLTAYRHELKELAKVKDRARHIRDAGASSAELYDLRQVFRQADALLDEQDAAIKVRGEGKRDQAIAVLFSPEYERELERIQVGVVKFQSRIDQRTEAVMQEAVRTSRLWRTTSEIMLGVTGLLFLCVLYFIFRRRVLHPVVKLSDVVTRLAAQDYAVEPPVYDQIDEIGDMAQALRIFRENGIERQRLERERDADRSVRDLLSRMTQRMQNCDTIGDLHGIVERFIPSIVPSAAGSLFLLDSERDEMVEFCSWIEPKQSRSRFPVSACWALRRGGLHKAAGSVIDVPCDHLEPTGQGVTETICLPLVARRGTLGLLYFEFAAGGASATVSDVYLNILAENVGLALDNLRLRDALQDMAMADPLTSLSNRRKLEVALESHVAGAQPDLSISCAMIDIDHFKRFNDEHGHDAGDAVLRAVGKALKDAVRSDDHVFRYGGEEFLLLMPGLGPEEAGRRVESIRASIAGLRLRHADRILGQINVSAGVACAPAHCNRDALVQAADAALYEAKRNGRNRVAMAPLKETEGRAIG